MLAGVFNAFLKAFPHVSIEHWLIKIEMLNVNKLGIRTLKGEIKQKLKINASIYNYFQGSV